MRQEPEWQFDDLDVAAAWKRIDGSLLHRFAPAEVLSVGVKAKACLGHWPRRSISDVGNPNARREILLAKLLDAAIARPLSSYAYADFFEAIHFLDCQSQLAALRNHNADKLVDENNAFNVAEDSSVRVILKELLQSMGLEPQLVSATAVFHHTHRPRTSGARSSRKEHS